VKAPPLGKHTLRVSNHVELLGGGGAGPILFQGEQVLSGAFEVVADSPPGDLIVNNDPALAAAIHASIRPTGFTIGKANPLALAGELRVMSVPTSIAFDVFHPLQWADNPLRRHCAEKRLQHRLCDQRPAG